MATSFPALLRAVYEVLSSDSTLTNMGVNVYDEVPETVTMPYVEFGEPNELKDDAHDRQGVDVDLTLHVWSRYRGFKEAADIVKALHDALDRVPLSVDGFTDVSIAANGSRFHRDPEPGVRHGVAPFRVWLTEDI